ncbi:hypothetical protein M0802_012599 [Mischocyttarus mexicanus]|nr:hypothetical protein M0802_012599 [Mischocyttarus mexicanus]
MRLAALPNDNCDTGLEDKVLEVTPTKSGARKTGKRNEIEMLGSLPSPLLLLALPVPVEVATATATAAASYSSE